MHYLPAPDRAFEVVSPVVIYRAIGRRPSQVYVDETMTATAQAPSDQARSRLSDLVYWRTLAQAGDQIHERPGTTLLVTASGKPYQIRLSPPQPLSPATAFTHAQFAAAADREVAAELLAAGMLTTALPRRAKNIRSRGPERLFAEQHPLVVEQPPEDLFEVEEDVRQRYANPAHGRQ